MNTPKPGNDQLEQHPPEQMLQRRWHIAIGPRQCYAWANRGKCGLLPVHFASWANAATTAYFQNTTRVDTVTGHVNPRVFHDVVITGHVTT